MRTRRIGSLEVSVVGLGCNNFGGRIDYDASAAVVHGALDAGITFFDTADIYGGTRSEEFLGRALGHTARRRRGRHQVRHADRRGAQRSQARLRAHRSRSQPPPPADRPRRSLPVARPRPRHTHRRDPRSPRRVRPGRQGDTRSAARTSPSSSCARPRAAVPEGSARFVSVQNEFSLLRRRAERDVLPECERAGLAFLPYFPLASGVLTGKYQRGHAPPAGARLSGVKQNEGPLSDDILAVVERLTEFAQRQNRTMVELAIAWIAAHRPVASVIVGRHRRRTGPRQCHRRRLGPERGRPRRHQRHRRGAVAVAVEPRPARLTTRPLTGRAWL